VNKIKPRILEVYANAGDQSVSSGAASRGTEHLQFQFNNQ
jgi:hypothetical protein